MTLNSNVRLAEAEKRTAVALADEVMEDPMTAAFELIALRRIARLASELCTAVYNGEKGIGGSRFIWGILAELRTALDAVEKHERV